jgi:hypothetical protein
MIDDLNKKKKGKSCRIFLSFSWDSNTSHQDNDLAYTIFFSSVDRSEILVGRRKFMFENCFDLIYFMSIKKIHWSINVHDKIVIIDYPNIAIVLTNLILIGNGKYENIAT